MDPIAGTFEHSVLFFLLRSLFEFEFLFAPRDFHRLSSTLVASHIWRKSSGGTVLRTTLLH